MKRLVLMLLMLILCSGCSNSVTCKEKKTNNSYKIVINDNNKIEKIILTYVVKEKDETQAKRTEENLRKQFKNVDNFKNIKVKRNGKTVTLTANVNYSFFFKDDEKSLEDVKKYFEDELNMVCYE